MRLKAQWYKTSLVLQKKHGIFNFHRKRRSRYSWLLAVNRTLGDLHGTAPKGVKLQVIY